jgi:anti-anti-sigma factor
MRPETGPTISASLDTGKEVTIIRLTETAFGSLDTRKLERVRGLLSDQAEKPNPPNLIVDLSAVQFFGASFVGILVAAWDRLRKCDRKLLLAGLTPLCRKLVQTLQLDKVFEIFPTQTLALEHVGQHTPHGDGAGRSPRVRVRQSEVAWDPRMLRLEYVGEDGVPIRSVIVPRENAPSL